MAARPGSRRLPCGLRCPSRPEPAEQPAVPISRCGAGLKRANVWQNSDGRCRSRKRSAQREGRMREELSRLPPEVMAAEHAYIKAWRKEKYRTDGRPLTGLAFSGGGIRSAVFCLGALQA